MKEVAAWMALHAVAAASGMEPGTGAQDVVGGEHQGLATGDKAAVAG